MKSIHKLLAVVAVTLLALCPVRADEAVDTFKKDMEGIKTFSQAKQEEMKKNPSPGASIVMMREMGVKLKAVKTESLPADLKSAYAEFVGVFGKMGDLIKGWPEKSEEITAYIQKKAVEDQAYMLEFGQKFQALGAEIQPIAKKLNDVAKKYGIDSLDEFSK